MASTYSPTLRIELIGDGDQSGIWGQTTNTNLGSLIEQAITGVVTIVMTDANYTLTAYNGVVDEARNNVLVVTGTNSAQRNIVAPLVEKMYIIKNSTTGGFGVQIIGATGTGVVIPNGTTASVYCDGNNFYTANSGSVGNFTVNNNLSVNGNSTVNGNSSVNGDGYIAGKLGVGTNSPGNKITAYEASGGITISTTTGGSTGSDYSQFYAAAGSYYLSTGVYGTGTAFLSTTGTSLGIETVGAYPVAFGTNSTERARLTSSGYFGINTSTPTHYLDVASAPNTRAISVSGATGAVDGDYFSIGGQYQPANTYCSSDVRFGVENTGSGKSYLAFATGTNSTTERMRITSAGNVGISNNNPSYLLDVSYDFVGKSNTYAAAIGGADSGVPFTGIKVAYKDASSLSGAGSYPLTAWSGGNINFYVSGTGSTALNSIPYTWAGTAHQVPYGAFGEEANGSTMMINNAYNSGNNAYKYMVSSLGAAMYKQDWGTHTWWSAPSGTADASVTFEQVMTISSGKVGIGTASPSTMLTVAGNISLVPVAGSGIEGSQIDFAGGSSYSSYNKTIDLYTTDMRIYGSGNWDFQVFSLTGTANFVCQGNVTAYSDARLKSDVKTITHALDIVDELRGVSFVKDGQAGIGVIAQEVQRVLPQVVLEGEEYLSVAYGNIVGVLIEAIKELRAEVKALKGE